MGSKEALKAHFVIDSSDNAARISSGTVSPQARLYICTGPPFMETPKRSKSLLEYPHHREPDKKEDNIRIYLPMDLNKDAILRRLDYISVVYEEAREDNETDFSVDVGMIISQLEIYDQIWFVRHMPKKGEHSREAKKLVAEIVSRLENIPDGGAESFPFELIDELKEEYLSD